MARALNPDSISGRVRTMLQAGCTRREIADAMPHVSPSVIKTTISKMRRQLGLPVPPRKQPKPLDYFAAEARARGLSRRALVGRLLDTISADRMVGAVLDDSPRPSRSK